MSHTTPIELSDINFDDDLLMDFDFTTVIPETQIEKTSPSNSQRDLSPEEAGKCRPRSPGVKESYSQVRGHHPPY